MITAGIESGARNTKVVILEKNKILGKGITTTGFDQKVSAEKAMVSALEIAGIHRNKIDTIYVTGSGKENITFADGMTNDIKAMAKGALYFFPGARTVVDVGGEEGRTAKIDETGQVEDFAINEKCAAGAGSFIEAMARALETPLEKMGPLALTSDKEIGMNAQCVVFAESEVVGLIHGKHEKKDISKSIHDAMASRVVSMIRRVGINKDVVILGGVGRNPGFIEPIQRELGLEKVLIPQEPEYGSAIGAAIVAREEG